VNALVEKNTSQEILKKLLIQLPEDTVIGEFSGRDSAAAIIKAFESSDINHILPIASFAPVEYGNLESLKENYEQLAHRVSDLYGSSKKLYPLVFYSNPDLWSVINGRYLALIIKKYEYYSPCIGCHLYFHLLRMPLALKLGKKIISGERENHDGKIKVNQLSACLTMYQKILSHFDVALLMPLRNVEKGSEIEKLLGWDWQEGTDHPDCAYKGNYRAINGQAVYEQEQVENFLNNYLYPLGVHLGKLLLQNEDIDKNALLKSLEKMEGIW
jgi:hypothetical protein